MNTQLYVQFCMRAVARRSWLVFFVVVVLRIPYASYCRILGWGCKPAAGVAFRLSLFFVPSARDKCFAPFREEPDTRGFREGMRPPAGRNRGARSHERSEDHEWGERDTKSGDLAQPKLAARSAFRSASLGGADLSASRRLPHHDGATATGTPLLGPVPP